MPAHKQKDLVLSETEGFTLVELLVVITIIAILATIGMTIFSGVQKAARDTKRRGDIDALQKAVAQYSLINKSFPVPGVTCSDSGAWSTLESALTGYITNFPKDPLNGQVGKCSDTICVYCYTSNMWCGDSSTDTVSCNAGVANVYAYQENCSSNLAGDSVRFKYGCPHYMKSIDPF